MKTALVIIFSLLCLSGFSQTSEPVTEEKASAWIKVVDDPVPVRTAPARKKTTTVKRKATSTKTTVPKPDAGEEFEKTNSQVNRFKKPQKG